MALTTLVFDQFLQVAKNLSRISEAMENAFKEMSNSVARLEGIWLDGNGKDFQASWNSEMKDQLSKYSETVKLYSKYAEGAQKIASQVYKDRANKAIKS